MRCLFVIMVLLCYTARCQDKLFFSDGQTRKGIIVSIAQDAVFFKNTDTSRVEKIKKSDLLMAENYRGVLFIFAEQKKSESLPASSGTMKRNSLGIQPLGILVGRGTVVYERYSKNQLIGFVIPLSITFDPFGSLYNSQLDTNKNAPKRISGINFISGMDVNFYIGKKEHRQFFIGPRLRYGTDQFLRGIEGYSLQTQVGWRFGSRENPVTQHLSVGFGFVNVLSSIQGAAVTPKKFYGWYSFNYRCGFGW